MHRSAIRKDGPRRIQRSIRDRTVFPRLEFEPLPLVGKQLLPSLPGGESVGKVPAFEWAFAGELEPTRHGSRAGPTDRGWWNRS